MSNSGIQWKWVGVAAVSFIIVQAVLSVVFGVFGLLTLGFGFILFIVLKPLAYFIGGFITGRLSPGITIKEPALAGALVAIVGGAVDAHPNRLFGIIIASVLAYFAALVGASLGENSR